MPRLYISDILIIDSNISITGDKVQYLMSVLRCKKGDELVIFDRNGNCYRTTILKTGRKEVVTEVTDKFSCDTESPLDIILIQCLLKGDRMDLVIQKTTELGVKEIIPAVSERSQLRETRKLTRWKKVAEEASRQSGRSVIPLIYEPVYFKTILRTYSSQEKLYGFIFYEGYGMKLSKAIHKIKCQDTSFPVYILIGPEGGFTMEEINIAKEAGLIVVSFGERIMRAETAAISAVTLVQFLLGDIA
jgi:16S rRNA (uracil1498-N3)-methyltransferase